MRVSASSAIGESVAAGTSKNFRRTWTIRTQSTICVLFFPFPLRLPPHYGAGGGCPADIRGWRFGEAVHHRDCLMPHGSRAAAPSWTIHSVAVRTRDGPERLDQVYRRLVDDQSSQPLRPAPDEPPRRADTAHVSQSRR